MTLWRRQSVWKFPFIVLLGLRQALDDLGSDSSGIPLQVIFSYFSYFGDGRGAATKRLKPKKLRNFGIESRFLQTKCDRNVSISWRCVDVNNCTA